MTDDSDKRKIKSLERTHRIIEFLRAEDGATISAVAKNVDLTAGSIHTYLATLQDMGYVIRTDEGYELGPEFITLGEYVRNQSGLFQAAKGEVDKLAERTEESVHLMIEHQGQGIALYERFGEEAVGTDYHRKLRQQPHQYLHCTASGKAILAHLPENQVDEIIERRGLAVQTPNTITDRKALFAELDSIREQGYAINDEEELLGIIAVGSPVRDSDGDVLGSISVSAPKTRMEQEEFRAETIGLVQRSANVCEVNLETEEIAT